MRLSTGMGVKIESPANLFESQLLQDVSLSSECLQNQGIEAHMKTRLLNLFDVCREGFWLMPFVISSGCVLAAFGMIQLDQAVALKVLETTGS